MNLKKRSIFIPLSFSRKRESIASSFWIPVFTGMTLCLLAGLVSSVWAGTYSDGTGEPNDPYLIATPNDLNFIGLDPCDWSKHFKITADINMAGYSYTTALIAPDTSSSDEFQGTPFTGIFDGNDNTIFSLIIDDKGGSNHYLGLFGYIGSSASVNNLNLEDVNITGGYFLGGLCGYNHYGTISNCYTTGSITGQDYLGGLCGFNRGGTISNCGARSSVSGDDWVGGLCGRNPDGTIINCHATCSVTGGNYSLSVGGLCGDVSNESGTIINSYASSSVNVGINSDDVGGLCGYNKGKIVNSYATGDVNGGDGADLLGGLCGANGGGTISGCYATGNVDGDRSLGGLCGYNSDGIITRCYATGTVSGIGYRIGGLCGWNYSGSITDCFSTGAVSGNNYIGGLCGLIGAGGTITSCFWDIETSDCNVSDGGTGLPTAQMQRRSTFTDAGWDFVEIWDIGENQTYPFLRTHLAGDIDHDSIVNFYDLAILADYWLEGTP